MLPVLINLKFVKIYTFGVFLVLAFFWGSFLVWRLIRLTSHKEEEIFDGLFITLFSSLFLGRLLYIIFNFGDFGFNILKYLLINGYPGLSLVGMIAGGSLGFGLYCRARKMKFREVVDYLVPAVFMILGFGKLGSFFSGSEAGKVTKIFLAVKYSGLPGMRHLTPFYEAVLFFIGSWLAYRFLFAIRRETYSKGFNYIFFLWYFGLVYFIFDNIKNDGLYFLNYNVNRTVSAIALLTLTVYFIYYFRQAIFGRMTGIKNLMKSYAKKTDKGIREPKKGALEK